MVGLLNRHVPRRPVSGMAHHAMPTHTTRRAPWTRSPRRNRRGCRSGTFRAACDTTRTHTSSLVSSEIGAMEPHDGHATRMPLQVPLRRSLPSPGHARSTQGGGHAGLSPHPLVRNDQGGADRLPCHHLDRPSSRSCAERLVDAVRSISLMQSSSVTPVQRHLVDRQL